MPEGVIAEVVDGFATVDFVDSTLRGPALNALLRIGGPGSIETLTREGPRRRYRVPEGNAREAGLLDVAVNPPPPPAPPPPVRYSTKQTGPAGPSEDWSRAMLDDHAKTLGIDVGSLRTKADVVAAIQETEKQ